MKLVTALSLIVFPLSIFAQTVPNDACETATVISALPYSVTQDTRNATTDANPPVLSCAPEAQANSVWFTFTPETDVFLNASTRGSLPFDYNTVLAIFQGQCGTLTELHCNDNLFENVIVQSEISFKAEAGVTYTFYVIETTETPTGGDLTFSLETIPLFRGPAAGTIEGGEPVLTQGLPQAPFQKSQPQHLHPFRAYEAPEQQHDVKQQLAGTQSQIQNFTHVADTDISDNELHAPILENGFPGPQDINTAIPPDPAIAAGPNHLVTLVNSRILFHDKPSGQVLAEFQAADWFSNVFLTSRPCNPRLTYDHFTDRWLMLWIECGSSPESQYLAVSDDADPFGEWCNWRLPGDAVGMTFTGLLNDFPKLGLDEQALYISSNMFGTTGYLYSRIRVIPKAQLFDETCGSIAWNDFWDLRNPSDRTVPVFNPMPAITFGASDSGYLIDADMRTEPGQFINLWRISDPSGTPDLSAQSVAVAPFTSPSNADQLGGSEVLLHVADRRIHSAVVKDGSLWASQSVGDASGNFSNARYLRIDVSTGTVLEDVTFGRENFWYMYPALMLDGQNNLFMAFSRSGLTEYAGARFTGKLAGASAGLQASRLLKAGEDTYVKTLTGSRNRWGGTTGIALDPEDDSKVWMLVEYAEEQTQNNGFETSQWGTWIGTASFTPEFGPNLHVEPAAYDFGLEFFASADGLPVPITLSNTGNQPLTIQQITLNNPTGPYALSDLPDLPHEIPSFGDVVFNVRYTPASGEAFTDSITIVSDVPNRQQTVIPLSGIVPALLETDRESIDLATLSGTQQETTLNLSNPGGLSLDFNIGFTGIATFTPGGQTQHPSPGNDFEPPSRDGAIVTEAFDARFGDVNKFAELHQVEPEPLNAPLALFQYDITRASGLGLALGVEFDGTYFWVTGGGANGPQDPNGLYQFDVNGNLVNAYLQGSTSEFGWRDLAFDGTYLYASDSQQIVQIDPATGQMTGVTIPGPLPLNRALAYDPMTDHFWTANFLSDIYEIDRQGQIVNQYPNDRVIYGMGWDSSNSVRPYLWVWKQNQQGETSSAAQFDPIKGRYTDLMFDALPLNDNNAAGGATIVTNLPTNPPNMPVLVGLQQDRPTDQIIGYALPPSWMTNIEPAKGSVASGGSRDIQLSFDALGLDTGAQAGGVIIGNSSFGQPRKLIEVSLSTTPQSGAQLRVLSDSLTFALTEFGNSSAVKSNSVFSIGSSDLNITDISSSNPSFELNGLPGFPTQLAPNQRFDFEVTFVPDDVGAITGIISIFSNDSDDPELSIPVSGTAFSLARAQPGLLYAGTGKRSLNSGGLLTLSTDSGEGELLGDSGLNGIAGVAIDSEGDIYAVESGSGTLYRIDASSAQTHLLGQTELPLLNAIAFDAQDQLYGVDGNAELFRIDSRTAEPMFIGNVGEAFTGLAFDPMTGGLWACGTEGNTESSDAIYQINVNTASAFQLGTTGLEMPTADIAFDSDGNLYGVNPSGNGNDVLISIHKIEITGTVIGETGFNNVTALEFSPAELVSVDEPNDAVPEVFSLEQNYPNPFNPTTTIRYTVPQRTHVQLTIFNLIGETVRTLVDEVQGPKEFEVTWDSTNDRGRQQASGVYLYRLEAGNAVEIKKMLLIK